MAIIIIMMFTMLVLWGSLAVGYHAETPENGKFLLGITLPEEYRGDPEVQQVLADYKKTRRRITWWGFAGCFLIIPLNGFISILIIFMIGWFAFLYHFYYENIRRSARRLYEMKRRKGWPYIDDDEYFLNGRGNRKSSGRLEQKRIGIGMTTNNTLVPTVGEKAIWIVMFLFVGGLSIFMMPFDFTKITMKIDGSSCRVQGASMGYTIDLDEVEDVTLFHQLPEMSKKHGYDSNRFFLGDFRVKDYGVCKVYVCLKNDFVIKVDTAEDTVWFNGATQEETEAFYRELMDAVNDK